MRPLLILLALAMPITGLPPEVDPFSDDIRTRPHHIRVETRHVEISADLLAQVIGKQDTYAAVSNLITQGNGSIIHSDVITARSREKATSQSILELIYPTEYTPLGAFPPTEFTAQPPNVIDRPPVPTAYEARNTGWILEIIPEVLGNTKNIMLKLDHENVNCTRFSVWHEHKDQWGKSDMVMPEFETLRTTGSIVLRNGEFQLCNTHTPRTQDGKSNPKRKILVFIRATIIEPR